jgi:hypothetical protein
MKTQLALTIRPRRFQHRIERQNFELQVHNAKNVLLAHTTNCSRESTDATAVLDLLQSLVREENLPAPTVNGKTLSAEEFLSLNVESLN